MPKMIKMYNTFMGGTDQFHQSIMKYDIKVRSKKWYWSIFAWELRALMVNSWRFYRDMAAPKLPQLEYLREVVNSLLLEFGVALKRAGKEDIFTENIQ
jgi:hypothetical protein